MCQRHRQRETERHPQRQRIHRDGDRHRDTLRDKERDGERDRQRHTHTEMEIQRESEREGKVVPGLRNPTTSSPLLQPLPWTPLPSGCYSRPLTLKRQKGQGGPLSRRGPTPSSRQRLAELDGPGQPARWHFLPGHRAQGHPTPTPGFSSTRLPPMPAPVISSGF